MNNRWLTGWFAVLTLGSAAGCGGSGDAAESGANGDAGRGNPASAGEGGSSSTNGGTVGTENGGAQDAGGVQNAGGTPHAGGLGMGGTHAAGAGGTTGMGGSISAPPPTFPLLVATSDTKVKVWQHADAAKNGDPATFELPVALGADDTVSGVVATRERLAVVSTAGIFLFDDLGKLGATSKPTAIIAPKALSGDLGGSTFQHEVVDADGDLWLTYGSGRVALFKNFNGLTDASKPQAEFTHEWEQIASSAYYAPADILFAPQVSGAGLLYFTKAKTKTGMTAPDGAFNSFTGWQSAVLGSSLFAAADSLGVWHGLDTGSTPRAPNATLSDSGLYLDASADAVVIADSNGNVSYFASASALTTGDKPETLKVKPFVYGLDLSSDAKTVATVSNDVVSLIDYSAGLKLRAALPLGGGQGNDVALVE